MEATGPKPDGDEEREAAEPAPGPMTRRLMELRDDPGREARWAAWRVENAEAIAAYNAWIQGKGRRYLRKPLF